MNDEDDDLYAGIPLGLVWKFGSDSLLLGGAGSATAVSIVLKALSLSLNLLSGLIFLTGVVSLLEFDSWKLASFCFILSDISVETLRAGWTKVSIFSPHSSSYFDSEVLWGSWTFVKDDGPGEVDENDKELVDADLETDVSLLDDILYWLSLLEITDSLTRSDCSWLLTWDFANDLYPSIALS